MAKLLREPLEDFEKLDLCSQTASLDPTIGARVVFSGVVRGDTNGATTSALVYDAYEPMAIRAMNDLEAEARKLFGIKRALVVHRLGRVPVGQISVLAIVESGHRKEGFAACEWLMNEIKKRVPIWKKDIGPNGEKWQHPSSGSLNPPSPESPS